MSSIRAHASSKYKLKVSPSSLAVKKSLLPESRLELETFSSSKFSINFS